jgi:hypothetical protein
VEKKQKTAVMKFKTDIIANLAVGGSMILYWQCKFRPSKTYLIDFTCSVKMCLKSQWHVLNSSESAHHWYWQYHSVKFLSIFHNYYWQHVIIFTQVQSTH